MTLWKVLKVGLGYTSGTTVGAIAGGTIGSRKSIEFAGNTGSPNDFMAVAIGTIGGAAVGGLVGFGASGVIMLILK